MGYRYRITALCILLFCLLSLPKCSPEADNTTEGKRPRWAIPPSDVTVLAGDIYNQINGIAYNKGEMNWYPDSPGPLQCFSIAQYCSFNVEVYGNGAGVVFCYMSFNAPASPETCNLIVGARDGKGREITSAIYISVDVLLGISDCMPNPADEGSNVSCTVISDFTKPVVDLFADTCGGTINGTGPSYTYDFVAGEASDSGGCNAAVELPTDTSVKDEEFVTINKINTSPTLTVDCPDNVNEGQSAVCTLTPSDPDLPNAASTDPGFVTCSLDVSNTCAGAVLTGCTEVTLPATLDPSIGSCNVVVNIEDGYGATGQGSDTITINDLCFAPIITNLPDLDSGHWGNPNDFDVNVTDADLPPESLVFSLENNTCSFTPSIDPGTGYVSWVCGAIQTCSVDVRVTDGCPAGALSDVERLYIECTNIPPSFTSTPANATEDIPYTYNVICSDSDGDTLTLTKSPSNTCPGTLTDNGNGTGAFSFTPTETMGGSSCVIGLICSDTQEKQQQNSTINIIEDNKVPVWNPAPAELWVFTNENFNNTDGSATDADLPAQTLTCAKTAQTCTFNITVSGSGAGGTSCILAMSPPTGPEDCQVSLEVSDGAGGTITQDVPIHVVNAPCIFRVDLNATGAGTGVNWTDAYTNIQTAVNRASPGCHVWVRKGVYTNGTTTPLLTMKDGVFIYGGFDTTETSPADRNLASNSTVLDGELLDKRIVIGASNARLDGFDMVNSRSSLIGGGFYSAYESGLSIEMCNFSGNKTDNSGGAMANVHSTLTISNSTFSDNNAYYFYYMIGNGGGIYDLYSDNTISNSYFNRNSADFLGGGIFNYSGALTISNSIFSENETTKSHGGAIFTRDADFYLNNGTFEYNSAFLNGGGICNYTTNSYIYNSSFYKNSNASYKQVFYYYNDYRGGYGGGIAEFRSSLYLKSSIFDSNSAKNSGGGAVVMNSPTDVYLYDNEFLNNTAKLLGGGGLTIADNGAAGADQVISNNIFEHNTAIPSFSYVMLGWGGAAIVMSNNLVLTDSYFYDNHADTRGAVMYLMGGGTISNCEFRDNSAGYAGGAISLFLNDDLDIFNSLIVNNSTQIGGAITARENDATTLDVNVINCTIANNTDTARTGGIFTWSDYTNVNIANSILFFNTAPQVNVQEGSMSIIYSDIQMAATSVYTGVGNINANPLFVGPTNYHLSQIAAGQGSTSPCVDTADPADALFGTTRTDSLMDAIRLDMGYHFPLP